MKRKTRLVFYIVDASLAVIFALVPTLIFNSQGFFDDMQVGIGLTYWTSFALSILVMFAFIMYCMNRPNQLPLVGFIISEVSALLFLMTPSITMFYLDGSYVTPLVINAVVLGVFLIGILITSTMYNMRLRR